jgi:hypothetical protein
MGSVEAPERVAAPAVPGVFGGMLNRAASALQVFVGLTTYLIIAWPLNRLCREHEEAEPETPGGRLARSFVLFVLAGVLNVVFVMLLFTVRIAVALAAGATMTEAMQHPLGGMASAVPDLALFILALVNFRQPPDYAPDFALYRKVLLFRVSIWRTTFRLLGTAIVLGMSLLPLSALLLAFPAINPQESVLTDAVSDRMSRVKRNLLRVFAVAAGLLTLVALLAVSVEVVTRLPLPEKGSFAVVARFFTPAVYDYMGRNEKERDEAVAKMPPNWQKVAKTPLHQELPPVMIEHWAFVILVMYVADLLILLTIGRVPLAYNLRNVRVRWKTNLMTAVAFAAVIGLLVFLLAFVNGMNNLTSHTGVPGNVFVLSDGATDELFSNLGSEDMNNVERVSTELDEQDRPLPTPVRVAMSDTDGRPKFLASRETYYAINQPIPNSNPPRRRFVQLRSFDDIRVGAAVHKVELYPGGKWVAPSGVDEANRIQCVLGEGVAGVLGADSGKKRLGPGDTFTLGDSEWVVTGVMKSEGTTFGSEIWVKRFTRIYQPFGKEKFTTLVMRTEQDTPEAAKALAWHLSKRYTQQKLKAYSEPDYYAELTKTNNFFLTGVVIVAVVMAIGGVFGMMTTMFASIAQRIRDIGVLRLLGFKRWQVTVSFLLESLCVAVVGGALGCLLAYLAANGRSTTSNLQSGGGMGGKSFALTIDVDAEVVAMGMLFTLVMGRLGGLVPALSAMRMKILDSLR